MISRRDALKLGAAGLAAPSLGQTLPGAAAAATEELGDSWPLFRAMAANTGESSAIGPSLDKPIVVKWRFHRSSSLSTPTVSNGIVFVDDHWKMSALDIATGESVWAIETGPKLMGSVMARDEVLYCIFDNGSLRAIDTSSQSERWRFDQEERVNASVSLSEHSVLFGCGDGRVYSVGRDDGSVHWQFSAGDSIYSTPAVSGGIAYIGSTDGSLYALDAGTGSEMWRFSTNDQVRTSPAVADGLVYFGSYDGNLYVLDAVTGTEAWRFSTAGPIKSSPIVNDDSVYFGSSDNSVYALACETGEQIWRLRTHHEVYLPIAIADGIVFASSSPSNPFISGDQRLYLVDANTGDSIATFPQSQTGSHGPGPVVSDGVILFGNYESLFALGNLGDVTLTTDVTLRGGPSSTGIERGTAKVGDTVSSVGTQEQREGQTWAEVTISGVTGWIPLDAIDPATLPPEGEIEYVYTPQ